MDDHWFLEEFSAFIIDLFNFGIRVITGSAQVTMLLGIETVLVIYK